MRHHRNCPYVPLGAKLAHRTGVTIVRASPTTSRSGGGLRTDVNPDPRGMKEHALSNALLAQHNFASSKSSTYPVRQPVRMVALDEIYVNFLRPVDTIDVVGVNKGAEDFCGR
jgi:hypothetical protein